MDSLFCTRPLTAPSTVLAPLVLWLFCGRTGVGTQHEARSDEVRPSAPSARRRRAADRAQDNYPAGACQRALRSLLHYCCCCCANHNNLIRVGRGSDQCVSVSLRPISFIPKLGLQQTRYTLHPEKRAPRHAADPFRPFALLLHFRSTSTSRVP